MAVKDDLALVLEQVEEAIAFFSVDWQLLQFNVPFEQLWNLNSTWLHTRPTFDAILLTLVAQGECSAEQCQQLQIALSDNLTDRTTASLVQRDGKLVQVCSTVTASGGWLLVFRSQRLPTIDSLSVQSIATTPKWQPSMPLEASQVLLEIQTWFQVIANALTLPIVVMRSSDRRVQYANPQLAAMLGICSGKLVDHPLDPYIHPEDYYQLLAAIDPARLVHDVELRICRANGSLIWVTLSAQLLVLNSEPTILLVLHDITYRKQVESKLRRIEATTAALIQVIPDLLIRMHRDGTYLDFFPAKNFHSIMPFTPMQGRNIREIMPPDIVKERMHYVELALQTGEMQRYEFQLLIDHTLRTEEARIIVCGSDQVVLMIRDITAQVAANSHELQDAIDQLHHEVTKTQATQAALQLSATLYQSMVTALHEGVTLLDADGTIQSWNASAQRILGLSADRAIGRKCDALGLQTIDQNGDPFLPETYPSKVTLKTGQSCANVVMGVYRPDGQLVWILVNSQPLAYHNEILPYAVVQSFTDITERTQIETELRESEERFRNLTENIEEVFWILDPRDWRIIYVSPAFETIWGQSRESLYGDRHGWSESIHPADREHFDWSMKNTLARYDKQYRIVRPDGAVRWIRDRAFPVLNSTGQVYRLAGIAEDITQQKLQDSRLRLLESVVVNANDSIVVTDNSPIDEPGPRIVYVNGAFTRLTGYTANEVIGKTPRILQGENTDRTTLDRLRATLQTWQPLVVELLNYRKNRSEFWIELSVVPVADETGCYTHWVAIQRDITQRKRFEEELIKTLVAERKLSELKSRFVATTSHEFRTPLSIILSSAELLEHYGHTWSADEQREHLHLIQSTVQHMTRLLEDILFIGQDEADKLDPTLALIEISEFCQTLITEIQRGIGKHHHLTLQYDCPAAPVWLDPKLIRQILNNLLSNAIKYSAHGSLVELRVTYLNPILTFQVQDWGIGVPEEDQPHLFKFFQRASNVSSIPGSGLGLAIAKRCTELHRGTIQMTSHIGQGTTFTVIIPAQQVDK